MQGVSSGDASNHSAAAARSHAIPARDVNYSILTGSPDPRCLLVLSQLPAWMLQLPVIWSPAQLHDSPFAYYLIAVYPHLSTDDFPLDLRCFIVWWHRILPEREKKQLFEPHLPENNRSATRHRGTLQVQARNGDLLPLGVSHVAWQIYLWEEPDHLPMVSPLMQHSRIEIFHDMNDCASTKPAGQYDVGYWAHLGPGSGIYAHLGKSLAPARGYHDACPMLLKEAAGNFNLSSKLLYQTCRRGWYSRVHQTIVRYGRQQGYNSVQGVPCSEEVPFRHAETLRPVPVCEYGLLSGRTHVTGVRAFEIILLDSYCPVRWTECGLSNSVGIGTCPSRRILSQGRSKPQACRCSSLNETFINCNANSFDC